MRREPLTSAATKRRLKSYSFKQLWEENFPIAFIFIQTLYWFTSCYFALLSFFVFVGNLFAIKYLFQNCLAILIIFFCSILSYNVFIKKRNIFEFKKIKNISINFFQLRIIISIIYIWIAFILTEDNTKFYAEIGSNLFFLVILVLLIGTMAFLYSEAHQHNPDMHIISVFRYKTVPVFLYSLMISTIIGMFINFSGIQGKLDRQVNKDNDYLLTDEMKKLDDLKDKIDEFEDAIVFSTDYAEIIPNVYIPYELERINKSLNNLSTPFTENYNLKIRKYNNILNELRLTDSAIKEDLKFHSLAVTTNVTFFQLDEIKISDINPYYIREFYRNTEKIDSIKYYYYVQLDLLQNIIKEKNHSLGYMKNKLPIFGWRYDSLTTNIEVDTNYNKSQMVKDNKNIIVPLNFTNIEDVESIKIIDIKYMLMQIVLALSIAIVAQLIISDKTATESL